MGTNKKKLGISLTCAQQEVSTKRMQVDRQKEPTDRQKTPTDHRQQWSTLETGAEDTPAERKRAVKCLAGTMQQDTASTGTSTLSSTMVP